MTDHEMLLLRAAVEACEAAGMVTQLGRDVDMATGKTTGYTLWFRLGLERPSDSLSLGLPTILRDLGADVPEWPSEERVAEVIDVELGLVTGDAILHDLRALPLPEYLALRGGS